MAKPVKPSKPADSDTIANPDTISIETVSTSVMSFLINPADLLINDSVAKHGSLSITAAQGITGGTVQILKTGQLQVVPTDPFKPSTSFEYTVSDGKGGTSSAVATVNYQVANSPPIAGDDSFTIKNPVTDPRSNFLAQVDVGAFLANDRDPNGDPLTIVGVTVGTNPTQPSFPVSVNLLVPPFVPVIEMVLPGGYGGAVSFNYVVADNHNAFTIGHATYLIT